MGQAKQRGNREERIAQALARSPVKSFTITDGYTGKPMKLTEDGISLDGVTFPSIEEAQMFISKHWSSPVLAAEVTVKPA